jgi:hypothetical protein
VFWGGDGVVFDERWAPVDEVGWDGGVWTEFDVVVAFVDEGAMKVLAIVDSNRL